MKQRETAVFVRAILLVAAAFMVPACHDNSSSGGGDGSTTVVLSGLMIQAKGGTGTNGSGGNGAYFYFENYNGSNARILQTGTVNSQFTVPNVSPNLGANPRTIAADTTIQVGVANTMTTVVAGGTTILGDDGVNPATGLRVLPGVTLTLNPWFETDGAPATMEQVYMSFANGVWIQGAIVLGKKDDTMQGDYASPHTGDVYVSAQNLVTDSTASITATGAAGATPGQGGDVQFSITGTIVNRGTINASGGDSAAASAANAGLVDLYSSSYGVYNTGAITASGGVSTSTTSFGGAADYVRLWSNQGGVYNSGAITAAGGNGGGGGGGANYVQLYTSSIGAVVNSGTINTSGGSATTDGNGGAGGWVQLYAYSGSLRVTGNVTTKGGNGAGAGNGGTGGYVNYYQDANSYFAENYFAGDYAIGADTNTSGGDGAVGGWAGYVGCYADLGSNGFIVPGQVPPVYLVGYSRVDISGGDGTTDGGNAGPYVDFYNYYGNDYSGSISWTGSLYNEVPVYARGGNGGTGAGGAGTSCDIRTYYAYPSFTGAPNTTVNVAPIDLRGGNGATSGGSGGYFYMRGFSEVRNSGTVVTSGGSGGTGNGGDAGYMQLYSDNAATNIAAVACNGGSSTGATGGNGNGNIYIEGSAVTCIGGISANGGNGTTGGNGGRIELLSSEGATVKSGAFSVNVGMGGGAPVVGTVRIDGIDAALTGGAVTY